ncbi:ArsR/SmtB family transcription factor [Rhodopila sp.]|uniref:ArsR/SmtB family transcription factor n=1 Tax=Rhodopila sp. TaxID=2480087 RepID=UPI002CC2E4D7|nr:metalloregulator ArsR/SmtB family transcription factor [Rhodopila sp.]HVZ06443.1 metalloregulator ArsR/SmtB family transcription factor [Rhodopila sp.]
MATMETLLASLRAAAEPTRLRLLALAQRGAFCVMDFTDILGQSQPRLSRHLKLLCENGLLERVREGSNVWFTLPPGDAGALSRDLIARLPPDDPVLEADRRQAARVLAERARIASESFRQKGSDWDEMRALGLPAQATEDALLALVPAGSGALLDIGTGTSRVLELLAPRIRQGLGVDASKAMLALARARLAEPSLGHCSVRLADMYRLPLPSAAFDIVVMQMVLHHAEDPGLALAEAERVLRPGGRLLLVDLAEHDRKDLTDRLAHRWPGFSDEAITALFGAASLTPAAPVTIPGPLSVRIWPATASVPAVAPDTGRHGPVPAGAVARDPAPFDPLPFGSRSD